MYLGELKGVGHVSSSWTESEFDHYIRVVPELNNLEFVYLLHVNWF